MISEIHDNETARQFFNFAGYPEYWPEGLDAVAAGNRFFGVFDPGLIGVFWLQFWNEMPEIHIAFLPEYRGKTAIMWGRRFIEWFFENTQYHGFFADIDEKHVAIYARACGMKRANGRFEVSRWERQ